MRVKQETLSTAITNLEHSLAASGPASQNWNYALEQALSGIIEGVRRQDDLLDSPNGGVTQVSGGQAPSSGVDRRVHGLHDDLDALLAEAGDLRAEVRRVQARATVEGTKTVDGTGLRRRAGALLAALNRYEQDEAWLILETATTEVGAGD
jgi:hypothetical protein